MPYCTPSCARAGLPELISLGPDGGRKCDRLHAEIVCPDAGKTSLFALRVFVGKKVKGLVLLERATEREAALGARVALFRRLEHSVGIHFTGKWIARLEGLVPEKSESIAVKVVTPALGHDVDDAPGRAPVLGIVITKNELKFLYTLLRNGRTDAVDGIVAGVSAVHAHKVRTGARAADI